MSIRVLGVPFCSLLACGTCRLAVLPDIQPSVWVVSFLINENILGDLRVVNYFGDLRTALITATPAAKISYVNPALFRGLLRELILLVLR